MTVDLVPLDGGIHVTAPVATGPVIQVTSPVPVVEVATPTVTVTVAPPTPIEVVVPTPGPAGPAGPQEVFVQQAQPSQGATAWYWFETDAGGDLTGNEWVYRP